MNVKNTPLVLCFLTTLSFYTTAWSNDTLLYKSDFEKRIFRETLDQKKIDFVALYSAINADSLDYAKYLGEIRAFYHAMDKKIADARSAKQKAKLIFKEVHDYFFVQYEEEVYFKDIFRDGRYNCLTASMLYSLILTKYNIPFEVKEKPTHVYLVAYPGTENILFETTLPKGIFMPDDKVRREYVAGLVTMKIVTQEYVNSVGIAKAFNEFYYDNESIDLRQLAGLQYFNEAIALYRAGDLKASITSAVKANTLYPRPKHLVMKTSLIREAISNSSFESLNDVLYLAEFANSATELRARKYVIGVFQDILNNSLIKKGDQKFVTDAYNLLRERVQDSTTVNEIAYDYNLGMGHWYGMKGDMDKTLTFAKAAYKVNEKDARLQELIVKAVALQTQKLKGGPGSIAKLDALAETFPFLRTHNTFRSLMVYQYAFRAYSLFLENSGTDAYKHVDTMEAALKDMDMKVIAFTDFLGMVYAEAGAYHFRKKEFTRAKAILQRGLEMVPDHGEIKERLRIVEQEQKY